VVTSSAEGDEGHSFGWINYDLIASGKFLPHCNNFGGEDRFWIGPEGGQFSIFFKKDEPFDLTHWQTPSAIDTEHWEVMEKSNEKVLLSKKMRLPAFSGKVFDLMAHREVVLMSRSQLAQELRLDLDPKIKSVGFKSVNRLTNVGTFEWTRSTGMLSIWILGQFIPSERNTVILPVNQDGKGPVVNDCYFGKLDPDRLKILPQALLLKGDGQKRGKIGVGPSRTVPLIGSYDPVHGVLTVVKFSFHPEKSDYINSMWEFQKQPFQGDVVNAYNDGPLPDGTIMGPFYELETSSAAANLKPGETMVHEHSTFHFMGDPESLGAIALKLLGVSLKNGF
jgi:hypothetical protein